MAKQRDFEWLSLRGPAYKKGKGFLSINVEKGWFYLNVKASVAFTEFMPTNASKHVKIGLIPGEKKMALIPAERSDPKAITLHRGGGTKNTRAKVFFSTNLRDRIKEIVTQKDGSVRYPVTPDEELGGLIIDLSAGGDL